MFVWCVQIIIIILVITSDDDNVLYLWWGEQRPGDRVCQNVRPTAYAYVCMYIYIRILRFSRFGRRCGVPCWRRREKIIIKSKIHIAFFHSDLLCLLPHPHLPSFFLPSPIPRRHTFRPIAFRTAYRTYGLYFAFRLCSSTSESRDRRRMIAHYFTRSLYVTRAVTL